jgi:hypothetical protein
MTEQRETAMTRLMTRRRDSLAHHVGRVDADRDSAAVGLITRHTLDVDAELAAVNREHLALAALEESTDLTRDTCT